MFRRVRFECGVCNAGFVDWHDEEWERTPVFCVSCGEPIVAGTPVDDDASDGSGSQTREQGSSLGILKGEGEGFPDTLRGLRAAQPISRPENTPAARAARSQPKSTSHANRPFARASSAAPRALNDGTELTPPSASPRRSWRRRAAPLGTFLLGFAAGVPLTLGAERLSEQLATPRAAREVARQLTSAASALDDGDWERARSLLDQSTGRLPPSDRRVATLRARLALDLILANRPDEARRQLSTLQSVTRLHPAAADIQRAFDAVFNPKAKDRAAGDSAPRSAVTGSVASVAVKPAPSAVKVGPTRQELLSFARDRQRRSLLDDAQHLYEAVLLTRPNDAEARCGLAEVQLLRGSIAPAQALFERALQSNANYIPAWVALGDIAWLSGHPERAACRYQFVVRHAVEGSYPPYITQRIARVTGSGVNPPTAQGGLAAPEACGP
ncbi:MAG: tetratricopeptide repeat protein [Pseudomonadota bacterium]